MRPYKGVQAGQPESPGVGQFENREELGAQFVKRRRLPCLCLCPCPGGARGAAGRRGEGGGGGGGRGREEGCQRRPRGGQAVAAVVVVAVVAVVAMAMAMALALLRPFPALSCGKGACFDRAPPRPPHCPVPHVDLRHVHLQSSGCYG